MAITLADAQAQLDAWVAASAAVAKGQSYRIAVNGSDRQLTRTDAKTIREMIEYWERRVQELSSGRRARARRVVFG